MKIKFVEGYYESTRRRDAVINESSQNSNFHKLAVFLTTRNADIKRNEDYTEFFNRYNNEQPINQEHRDRIASAQDVG